MARRTGVEKDGQVCRGKAMQGNKGRQWITWGLHEVGRVSIGTQGLNDVQQEGYGSQGQKQQGKSARGEHKIKEVRH